MGDLHITRTIAHPAASAWAWIRDFGNIHRIHPSLGKSWIEGEQSCGVGAARVCEMKAGGFRLRERVTEWRENESYSVEMFETSMPLVKRGRATLGVRPLGARSSLVYMHAQYDTKYGAAGRLCEVLFLNAMMSAMMRMILRKLDRTLATAPSAPPAHVPIERQERS